MEYFQIAIELILLFLFLYFLLAKSYFSEKGKNIATKEDIGKITQEIEIVKKEISIRTKAESEFIKERKVCLLGFFDRATYFVNYSTKFVDTIANNQSDLNLIRNEIERMRLEGAKLVSSFLKLHIYFDSEIILETAKVYYDSMVKLQISVISTLFQVEQSSQKEKAIRKMLENGGSSNLDGLYDIIKLRKKLIEDHINERVNLLDNEIFKNQGQFINEIKIFLKIKE